MVITVLGLLSLVALVDAEMSWITPVQQQTAFVHQCNFGCTPASTGASMRAVSCTNSSDVFFFGGIHYDGGGSIYSSDISVFNVETSTWRSSSTSMPAGAQYQAGACDPEGNYIYIQGGVNAGGQVTSFYRIDTVSLSAVALPDTGAPTSGSFMNMFFRSDDSSRLFVHTFSQNWNSWSSGSGWTGVTNNNEPLVSMPTGYPLSKPVTISYCSSKSLEPARSFTAMTCIDPDGSRNSANLG
jgi:hypothetical protein